MPVSVIPVAINLNQECRRGGTGRHGDMASLWTQVRVSSNLTAGTAAPCSTDVAERTLKYLPCLNKVSVVE